MGHLAFEDHHPTIPHSTANDPLVAYSPFDDPLERVSAWQSPDKLRRKLM